MEEKSGYQTKAKVSVEPQTLQGPAAVLLFGPVGRKSQLSQGNGLAYREETAVRGFYGPFAKVVQSYLLEHSIQSLPGNNPFLGKTTVINSSLSHGRGGKRGGTF